MAYAHQWIERYLKIILNEVSYLYLTMGTFHPSKKYKLNI
jgi:hypothetical protein